MKLNYFVSPNYMIPVTKNLCLMQMFEWISHNRDLFLVNYTEIGTRHQMAVELESEHCQFATSAEVSLRA